MQKAYDKVWHAGVLEAAQEWWHTGKLWRIIHELYANSASTPIIEGQTTETVPNRAGRCSGLPHVTYTVQRVH
jgi:gamma-glutamyl:cysteine ligase YbdK (ATP-grasp superfamily)